MSPRRDAVTPPGIFQALLSEAGDDVLVGGQALGFWVQRYDLPLPRNTPAITADVDFLADSPIATASVVRYARALGGDVSYPNKRAMTSLVGQAYRIVSDEEYINVDVLWRLIGIDAKEVLARAVTVSMGAITFRVMHPVDVLRSRLMNLYKLADKQNPKGEMQLRMAIDVTREFLREKAARQPSTALGTGRSPIQRWVSDIECMAIEDAGRKVSLRHGICVADAIDPTLIPAGPFWTKRWPTLKTLMSDAYRAEVVPPAQAIALAAKAKARPKAHPAKR